MIAKLPERRTGVGGQERRNPLAPSLDLERYWEPDEDAMLGALRVVLGLPAHPVLLQRRES
jgi:hypothetical protein